MKRNNEITLRFGKRLRMLREQRDLNSEEVARSIGVSPSTYRDWENGRAITGLPYLALCKVLGVSLKELFGVEDLLTGKIRATISVIENSLGELKQML